MRILYMTQSFPPEVGTSEIRAYEMATNLVRMGHEVTVICNMPNHPKGVVFPGYRGKLYVREVEQGVEIIRTWCFVSEGKNFVTRMMFYLSFAFTAAFAGVLLRKRLDVVYASSPPLFVAGAGRFVALWKRTKYIFEVRDIWPDVAIEMGELRGAVPIGIARWLENWCYRGAVRIVGVTEGILRRIEKKRGGIYADRLRLITNGANTELFRPVDSGEVRRLLGLEGKFVVIYGGIMGICQGLETAVECAGMMKDENVAFLMVGEGPEKKKLIDMVEARGLKNVIFHSEVPREKMPEMLCSADASYVPLKRLPVFLDEVPGKIYESMACGMPLILGVDGEARMIVEKAQAGMFVTPEDPRALADAIRTMMDRPIEWRVEMGRRGRTYVEQNYSRREHAERLARELDSL